jgi:hypothetical protein
MAGDGWKSEGAFVAVINLLTALIYCARRRTRAAKVKNAGAESRRAPPATLCMTPHEIDFCTQRNMGGTDQCFYWIFRLNLPQLGCFRQPLNFCQRLSSQHIVSVVCLKYNFH